MSVTTVVATTAQLLAAIAGANPGDVIKLAPGAYSNVAISNKNVPQKQATPGAPTRVLIVSEYTSNPAVLTDLSVRNSTGLYFANMTFSTATTPVGSGGGDGTIPFQVTGSSQMTFIGIKVAGSPTETWSTDVGGMYIAYSTHVAVENSSFNYLHSGITQYEDNYVSLTGTSFSNIADDGIRGGGTSNITISGDTFTSQHVDATDPEHPDAIQFWTTNTPSGVSNVTITNNTISRGSGTAVQGIFLNDEVGTDPYRNVLIQGNSITGESYNGIVVDDGISTRVLNNTVTSYPDYKSQIAVLYSLNATVSNNKASSFGYAGDVNLTQSSNTIIPAVPYGAAGVVSVAMMDSVTDARAAGGIPEPSVWSMMLLGAASCGGLLRSRPRRSRREATSQA